MDASFVGVYNLFESLLTFLINEMTKLHLTNDQASALFSFLSEMELDRIKNRQRWQFLDVLLDNVSKYRDQIVEISKRANSIKDKDARDEAITQANERIEKLNKSHIYEFANKEVFKCVEKLFEQIGDKGLPLKDKVGRMVRGSDNKIVYQKLAGKEGRWYREIEDAFLSAEVIREKTKEKAK